MQKVQMLHSYTISTAPRNAISASHKKYKVLSFQEITACGGSAQLKPPVGETLFWN